MKRARLVLEKVDKKKYWGKDLSLTNASLSVDLVKVSNHSLFTILRDSAHPVPHAYGTQDTSLVNGKVSKRRRVPKRMADGTLPMRQVKQSLTKSIISSLLNRNANNNESTLLHDSPAILSHDSRAIVSHDSHMTSSCNSYTSAFMECNFVSSSNEQSNNFNTMQIVNGDCTEMKDTQKKKSSKKLEEVDKVLTEKEKTTTSKKRKRKDSSEMNIDGSSETDTVAVKSKSQMKENLLEKYASKKKKQKDLSEVNIDGSSETDTVAVKSKSQMKEKLHKKRKVQQPEQEKKRRARKNKNQAVRPSGDGLKKRGRPKKNPLAAMVPPSHDISSLHVGNDPQSVTMRIVESFNDDQARHVHVSRNNESHMLSDYNISTPLPPHGADPIIITKIHVTNEDSLSSNAVQVQENIDNVLEPDCIGSLLSPSLINNETCETTCLEEGFAASDQFDSSCMCNPDIFLSSPWPDDDSPSAEGNKVIMEELLDGTILGCDPEKVNNSIECGCHDNSADVGCGPGDSNNDTSLGCDPGLSTLNENAQDGSGLYSSPLTNTVLELTLESSGNVSEGILPNTGELSIPFSSLDNDNVKLNDCVKLESTSVVEPEPEPSSKDQHLFEPVVTTSCIEEDETVSNVKVAISESNSHHTQSGSAHSQSDPSHCKTDSAYSGETTNSNVILKPLSARDDTNPTNDSQAIITHAHKMNDHTHFTPPIPNHRLPPSYEKDIDQMYMEDDSPSDQELVIDEEFKDILNKSESSCLNSSTPTVSDISKPLMEDDESSCNVKKLDPVVKDSFTFNLRNLGVPAPITPSNTAVKQTPSLFSMKNENALPSLFRSVPVVSSSSSFHLVNHTQCDPPKLVTVASKISTQHQPPTTVMSGETTPISFAISRQSPPESPTVGVAIPTGVDGDSTNDSIHLGNDEEDKVSLCCEDTFTNENNGGDTKKQSSVVGVSIHDQPSTTAAVTKWLANSHPSTPPSMATPINPPSSLFPPVAQPSLLRRPNRPSRWDVMASIPHRASTVPPHVSSPLINPPLPRETYPRHPPPPPPLPPPFTPATPLFNHNLPVSPQFNGFSAPTSEFQLFQSQPRTPTFPSPLFGPRSFSQEPLPPPHPPPSHPPPSHPPPSHPPPTNDLSSWSMPNEELIYTSIFDYPLPSRRNRKVQDLGLIDLEFLTTHSHSHTIPSRLMSNYVLDWFHVSQYHNEILRMMKALLEDDYVNAGFFYLELTSEKKRVTLEPSVSRAVLLLCSWQTATNLIPHPHVVAQKAINDMFRASCRRSDVMHVFDHLNLMHTLANYDKIADLYEEYLLTTKRYKVDQVPEHFAILLSKAHLLNGYKVIDILIDAIAVLNKEDMLKFTEEILHKVDVSCLQKAHDKLSVWIIGSKELVKELSLDRIIVLLSILTKTSEWFSVLVLIELFPSLSSKLSVTYLPNLFDKICNSNCDEMKTRLMTVIPKLTDEQIPELSQSDWFTVLECSLNMNQLQAAMWLFIKMNSFKISLDNELTLKLLKMLVDNDSHQPTKNILRIFLASSIELGQFTRICEIFQKDGFIEHLYMICAAMIDNKLPIPFHSLKWLLNYHINIEKTYQQLANLIKQASFRKVVLSYPFYEQVLPEIRSWGKDMEALDIVYKCLQRRTIATNGEDVMGYSSGIDSGAPTQDTVSPSYVGSFSVSPLSSICMYDDDDTHDDMDIASSIDNSMDIIVQNPVIVNDDSDTVLIKRSGAKEQFGSVAIVLTGLDEDRQYSSNILLTCISVLTNESNNGKCHPRYKQLVEAMKTIRKDELNVHDRWLLQQLGVALICHCESHSLWSDGFNVLHCLHQNDINYLQELAFPHAMTPPPSICSVAMKAISICLEAKRLQAAVVVLEGCKFATGNSPSEIMTRTELLLRMAVECVNDDDLKEHSINCIEAIVPTCPKSLYGKLKHTVLLIMKKLVRYNVNVNHLHNLVKLMLSHSICISYETCTLLVKQLQQKIDPTAIRGLVDKAIKAGCYQIQEDKHCQTSLTVPPSLTKLETELILKHHLSSFTPSQYLKIYCSSESLHDVESAVGKLLSPSAVIKKCVLSPAPLLSTRICLDVSLRSSQNTWSCISPIVNKKPPSKKQEFKRKLCAEVMKAFQQYQKSRRFDNEESYKKLVSLVYQYFQRKEVESEYILTNQLQVDIAGVVTHVMSQVDVYCGQDIDLSSILSH